MDPFVYRDGDVVPRDVTCVVVHPSVRVLPPGVFQGCRKLKEIQLNEGLKEIGSEAFWGCVSLMRLNCPSTVVRIEAEAFGDCEKLEEVQLNEGLKEIGHQAFWGCVSLRRLNCPSTVLWIGTWAFAYCSQLEKVQLNEGLKQIGYGAFCGCRSSRGLRFPSTLAGILKVERRAFADVQSRIQIPSRAFMVQEGNCRLVTNGTIAPTPDYFVLIAPGCLAALPESNLTELGNSIGEILINGEGTEEDRLNRFRQIVRKEVRGEVSVILGLAFWRAKIDEAKRACIGAVNDRREKTGGGQEAREGCQRKVKGKAKVIAQNVLLFLDALLGKRIARRSVRTEDTGGAQEAREGCRREVEGKGKLIAQNVLPFLDGLWGNGSQGGL